MKRSRAARGAPPDTEQVYELAVFVLDIAGIYMPALCRAAHSLCELVHRMKAAGKWDWPAIDVHVSAMRLLLEMKEGSDASAKVVLDGLGGRRRQVSRSLAARSAQAPARVGCLKRRHADPVKRRNRTRLP
ncbi:MAG: hypothetical protein WDM79_04165 [Terricaulis sp.]